MTVPGIIRKQARTATGGQRQIYARTRGVPALREGRARFVIRDDGIERIFDYGVSGWHDFEWARDTEGR
jgi:hypothetical protein